MREYVFSVPDANQPIAGDTAMYYPDERDDPMMVGEEVVRCRDCKHLDDSEYKRWDNSLAECYGEPPLFCNLLSFNEWRMDGDRRVAETSFAEVEPDGFCAWGKRRDA